MREMHKWKDKIELSLDNRQIFFLFFGLSVVGCFVFALGVMTGRRVDWEPEGEVAALAEPSLAALEADLGLTFPDGLGESMAGTLPPTRDPDVPPRREGDAAAVPPAAAVPVAAAQNAPEAPAPTLAAAAPTAESPAPRTGPRVFTLQMKAFSRADEAEAFADKLRRNGRDVRVEPADIRGRTWHRVRLGRFSDWNEALAAKTEFEKAEHVIAYVVSE
jgi:cell division septation protein DedD